MPGLSAGEGAGRGGAGLQCARWTREGSSTLRERRLVTNGIPSRGSSPAGGFQGCRLGGSEGAAGEVRHAARPGRDPVPSLLGTRAHPRIARGLFCASETSGGSNGAVPQALVTRTWSRQTSVSLVWPGDGACWSTSGSDLCPTIVPLAEQV